jgi:signal peptidase I
LNALCQSNSDAGTVLSSAPCHVSSDSATILFEDILNKGLSLRVRVTGSSMRPCLRGGEIVTIKKVSPASLKTGDLVFFKNAQGKLVLHRLVRIKRAGEGHVMQTQGDRSNFPDEPFSTPDFLGKACTLEKTGGEFPLDLESPAWKVRNYLTAMNLLVKSRVLSLVRSLYRDWSRL